MRGYNERCLHSLAKLRRRPSDDEMVQLEWKGILVEVQFQKEILPRQYPDSSAAVVELRQWLDMFRLKYLKRTAVAMAIPFFQQVGILRFL
jgi:hypothetical protein